MITDKKQFMLTYKRRFMSLLSKHIDEATVMDKYIALASIVREEVSAQWVTTNRTYLNRNERQVYYFSLEFLLGKQLSKNLEYLGVRDMCREALEEMGISLSELEDCEPDAGLGNGGLGRLAACFMDSLASMELPGHGCGIRYKHGLFRQQIVDGYQVELPDNWLRHANPWELRKPDKSVLVKMGGHVRMEEDDDGEVYFFHEDYSPVIAVPYDMPVAGRLNNTVNTLRLWSAEAPSVGSFDFGSFSRGDHVQATAGRYEIEAISEVLYPDDSNYVNKQLRLKQQYFFVSAGVQSIVRHYMSEQRDLHELPDHICIHINDTHPALAVPELMRILIDEGGVSWDKAWDMTTRIIAYTNHTILPEALEKWPVDVFRELLPRIYLIVEEIDRRFRAGLELRYPGDTGKIEYMAIIADGVVRMANLAVVGSFSVNGVAAVHSELLKNVVMRDMYDFYPEKFNNKTNGITHRRWLLKSNPDLAALISGCIGDQWIKEPPLMKKFEKFKKDKNVQKRLFDIKRGNKLKLIEIIKQRSGIAVDPDSIFDVQVKRIHAYKRQLLNAFHIQYLYSRLLEDSNFDIVPHTFIIAGKAAPSYYLAKSIIKYINDLSALIEKEKRVREKLKVVFLSNYNVALAEQIFPASDISEQISTASKEASGTGNMKFMMNGAITVGTDDGANIEIREHVGDDNFVLFGLSVDEVLSVYSEGSYSARDAIAGDPRLDRIFSQLTTGSLFSSTASEDFESIHRALIDYNDEFLVLKDFGSYVKAHEKLDSLYRQQEKWASMSIVNIAKSGHFSSDNTIKQYANELWKLKTCKIDAPDY